MGTVSLKNICDSSAEFAIAIRKKAMGKGYSNFAIKEIIRKGIDEMQLKKIYWCVDPNNERAIRLYEKNGYMRTTVDNINVSRGGFPGRNTELYLVFGSSINNHIAFTFGSGRR